MMVGCGRVLSSSAGTAVCQALLVLLQSKGDQIRLRLIHYHYKDFDI